MDPAGAEDRRSLLSRLTGAPIVGGNEVQLLYDGDVLPAMLEAIRSARRTVDLMTYVWWGGEVAAAFAEALADRARDGVRVRLLLDSVGCRGLDDRSERRMRAAGVHLEVFRPHWSWKVWQLNMRTHRRVLVCDDEVAFTGGAGIGQEWIGDDGHPPWRETHLRLRGPAIYGVHAGFYTDWFETPNPPFDDHDVWHPREEAGDVDVQVLLGTSQPGWNLMALALRALLATARRHVHITTAYFRAPRPFRRLLCDAAARGIEVDVLVPGPAAEPPISRQAAQHHYEELLEHGVRIHEYQPSMLHAKVVTVDSEVAMVGTCNVDARSLALNEQIAVILHDARLAAELDERFTEDLTNSRTIDLDEWQERGRLDRTQQWLAHASTFPIRGAGATRRAHVVRFPPQFGR